MRPFRDARVLASMEVLESRRLASVSYVQFGKVIEPDILDHKAAYFAKSVPVGDFLIAVLGGSLTYHVDGASTLYRVNDYDESDHGYKVVAPGMPRFDAPGLSVARSNSRIVSDDSKGVSIKFRHTVAGKIGIEIYDDPYYDNLAGVDGSPRFVLKMRVVTPTPLPTPAVAQAQSLQPDWAVSPFSSSPLVGFDQSITDPLDQLTQL
jgi:hypothetical protein